MSAEHNTVESVCNQLLNRVAAQMPARGVKASVVLYNATQTVLRGQGGGRRYRVPFTKQFYTASAPGDPPAVRTGTFRSSFHSASSVESSGTGMTVHCQAKSEYSVGGHALGILLENGTSRMAPRPYRAKVLEQAGPKIHDIFQAPYFQGGGR